MKRTVNLGLIQMTCSENIAENFDKTIDLVKDAAGLGANIVCTQELFKSRYFCQSEDWRKFDLAEEINENNITLQKLSKLAAELEIVLIASLFEKRGTGIYHNTAVVFDADGRYLGKYRKMHIPDDPYYYEKYYFTPGDLGYKVFKTRFADIGVLICWDQWFPEAARLLGLQGAEIIFIPTAIGFSSSEEGSEYCEAWKTVQQGHAVANACFLTAVNRVGFENEPNGKDGIKFWGQSFIADPYGRVLKQASGEQEEVVVCPIDLSFIEKVKTGYSFPYRDRRVDSYRDLLQLYSK
jgi:N-carbamoylputrescine amidase